MSRAQRRHIREVLIKRTERLFKQWGSPISQAIKRHNHPDDCQHAMCRNPRYARKGKDRLTIRERKQQQD